MILPSRSRRFAVASLALACGLIGIAGCADRPLTPQQATIARQRQIVRLRAADAQRLEGEPTTRPTWHVGHADMTAFREVFVELPTRLWHSLRNDTPLNDARKMEDSGDAENRREGMLKLTNYYFARTGDYVVRYRQIYDHDADALVRAAALRALNRCRDQGAVDRFIAGLGDTDGEVRLEAAKGLANVPSPRAVSILIRHLNDATENKDVRIACADALRTQHTPEVARALINMLRDKDFGIAWQAKRSLVIMTGHDLDFDPAAWLNYLNTEQTPFAG